MSEWTWEDRAASTSESVAMRARMEGCDCDLLVEVHRVPGNDEACRVVVKHERSCKLMADHNRKPWRRGRESN